MQDCSGGVYICKCVSGSFFGINVQGPSPQDGPFYPRLSGQHKHQPRSITLEMKANDNEPIADFTNTLWLFVLNN